MIALAVLALMLGDVPNGAGQTRPHSGQTASRSFQQLSLEATRAREAQREDEAFALYKQALALRPEWEEGLWYLGTSLWEKEQYAPARDILRRFVALRPDAGAGWALLGLCEYHGREYSRALDHLQRAMSLGMGDRPDLKQSAFESVVVLLTRFERYDDSIGMLSAMVNSGQCDAVIEAAGLAGLRMPLLPSEIPEDRHNLIRMAGQGLCAAQQGNSDQALQLLEAMVKAYPNEPGVRFLLGSYLMNFRPEDGIREMQRELEISPSHVAARNRLAEQYVKMGQYDEALALAQEAKKLAPENFSVSIAIGEALLGKGDTAEGVRELEHAREMAPDNVRIRWDLVRAYSSAGRNDDAAREKQAIEKLTQSTTPDRPKQ